MVADPAKPLDAVLAAGPDHFLVTGLAPYLAVLGGAGEAAGEVGSFEDTYGVPLPGEVAALLAAMEGRDRGAFAELRLDGLAVAVPPSEAEVVPAMCGVFPLGGGYFMELYAWAEARQIVRFENDAFVGVVADSLEAFAFLGALVRAHDEEAVSAGAFATGLHRLRGRVAPLWQLAITDRDPGFPKLEPTRRDTEFFCYRSAWIAALLRGADLDEVSALFRADLNQHIPPEQLPARLEACARFVPTALYALWRAFLFAEPELERYLEIGRRHAARLVRAVAMTIDELCAGRNELGPIADVTTLLAAFRALGLGAERAGPVEPGDDAWGALRDGVAHRALLRRLDREHGDVIAALDELSDLDDHDRAIALPKVALGLPPELEAVLVGSLVRDDDLADVLRAPASREARVRKALAMSRRALRLAPRNTEVQFTHAMMMLDAGEVGELFELLPVLQAGVRANVAVHMAMHARFVEAVDLALADHREISEDLFAELGEAVLAHAPRELARMIPRLPADIDVLGVLAYKAIVAGRHDDAIALYDALLALPIPDAGHARGTYLRALNNACVQAHAAEAYDAAVRIADRAQPVAHENPYIYHAAACAYAAIGEYAQAFAQVKLAVQHDYDHLVKVETDRDLGPLLEWPEFQALFRDWRARLEGN